MGRGCVYHFRHIIRDYVTIPTRTRDTQRIQSRAAAQLFARNCGKGRNKKQSDATPRKGREIASGPTLALAAGARAAALVDLLDDADVAQDAVFRVGLVAAGGAALLALLVSEVKPARMSTARPLQKERLGKRG